MLEVNSITVLKRKKNFLHMMNCSINLRVEGKNMNSFVCTVPNVHSVKSAQRGKCLSSWRDLSIILVRSQKLVPAKADSICRHCRVCQIMKRTNWPLLEGTEEARLGLMGRSQRQIGYFSKATDDQVLPDKAMFNIPNAEPITISKKMTNRVCVGHLPWRVQGNCIVLLCIK